MNNGGLKGVELAAGVAKASKEVAGLVEVVVAPPFTALAAVSSELEGSHVEVAAQNFYPKDSGAFTGEISAPMLKESGATWVIIGHSERRQYFGETDAQVGEKVAAATAAGLKPIACIGETLAEREAGKTMEVVFRQLETIVPELNKKPGFGVIAYEPVWANRHGQGRQQRASARSARRDSRATQEDQRRAGRGHPHSLWRQREGRQRRGPLGVRRYRWRAGRRGRPGRRRLRKNRQGPRQSRLTRTETWPSADLPIRLA